MKTGQRQHRRKSVTGMVLEAWWDPQGIRTFAESLVASFQAAAAGRSRQRRAATFTAQNYCSVRMCVCLCSFFGVSSVCSGMCVVFLRCIQRFLTGA